MGKDLNGKELEEEYLSDDVVTKSDVFNDFIVPEGHFFAMGDNRGHSAVSRRFGCSDGARLYIRCGI